MARPPMPLGTHGSIRYQRAGSGNGWRARAQVRGWDGQTRPIERTGTTKSKAADALRTAVRDRVRAEALAEVTPETKVSALAEVWITSKRESNTAKTTVDQYRRIVDRFTVAQLGNLRVRELTASVLDRHIKAVAEHTARRWPSSTGRY